MMQNSESIETIFYVLEEFSQSSIKIPKDILIILSNYVDSSSPYIYNTLSIFNNIVNDNFNFIHQKVIPIILGSYESFDINSLAKSATLVAETFIHLPDPAIGDFIANCLLLNQPSDEYNIVDDQLISTLFEKRDWIDPYQPIVLALITKLEENDGDISNYGICSMSQSILMSIFNNDPELVGSIIADSISKEEDNINNGYLFRCLSIIISNQEIVDQYIPIIFDEINEWGDFRGDAALCLSRYCEVNRDSDEIIEKSFSSILPLLEDADDPNIRYQSIISIQNLFRIIPESFQPSIEHLEFLVNLIKTPELSDNLLIFAELIESYMCFFISFDDFLNESSEDAFLKSFFNDVVDFFLNENESDPLFVSFISILSIFLSKTSNIIILESVLPDIIDRSFMILDENDFIGDSNIDEIYSCLVLLEPILILNNQLDENKLSQCIDILIKVIKSNNESQILIQKAFEISLILYQIDDNQLMMSDQLISFYLEECSNYFSTTNLEISYIVAQILMFLVPRMEFQQMQLFLKKSSLFVGLYGDRNNPVFDFGHQLYHILSENSQDIDPFIIEFFEHDHAHHCCCINENSEN